MKKLAILLLALIAAARAAADDAALVTRRYDVLPSIESYFTPDSGNPGDPFVLRVCGQGDNGAGVGDALRDYAAERGVTWPEGSGVEYLPASGCVEMRNTEANHAVFRDVVARFAAFQIRARAQFVSVASDAVAALGLEDVLGGSLAPEEWAALRARLAAHPGAELRGCVSMLAQTGVQTTGKGVVEAIYPTDFDVRLLRAEPGAPVAAVEPRNYQTREVGEIVQFTPRVDASGLRITFDLTPCAVLPPAWREFAPAGFRGSLAQPHFPVFSFATSLDLLEGRTVALGGATVDETGRGPRCEVLFLTAELVGLDGLKPQRQIQVHRSGGGGAAAHLGGFHLHRAVVQRPRRVHEAGLCAAGQDLHRRKQHPGICLRRLDHRGGRATPRQHPGC